jgi:hypothetical protein
MNREQAKKLLQMLDRIHHEIDILGQMILRNKLKPVPVHVKNKNK